MSGSGGDTSTRVQRPLRVLIASGFFESELVSFREYAYSEQLSRLGHQVTLMCGDQSYIWKYNTVGMQPSVPTKNDREFASIVGVRLLRRKVLLRFSDCVLYVPSLQEIRSADVVHVIEFRQGITMVVAVIARLFGKPIVYDHEQRGDRSARWYNRVDSTFRRLLIRIGALTVDCVRHTVLANANHFRSCSRRRVPMIFAPLGANPRQFYFDLRERQEARRELGVADDVRVAIMSGKLHEQKRVLDVVNGCRQAGVQLILVGTMSSAVEKAMRGLAAGNEIVLQQASAGQLRRLYNAADVAVFTTFTVSYWEAYATGIQLVVPDSAFTRLVFEGDTSVCTFGEPSMFEVPDEQYALGADITFFVERAIRKTSVPPERQSRDTYSTEVGARQLAELYAHLVKGEEVWVKCR